MHMLDILFIIPCRFCIRAAVYYAGIIISILIASWIFRQNLCTKFIENRWIELSLYYSNITAGYYEHLKHYSFAVYMWSDLPIGILYTHSLRHTFHWHPAMHQQHMCLVLLKVEQSAFTQAFSQACLVFMSAWVAFKWLHLHLASRQLTVNQHTTGWWWVWP